MQQYQNYPAQYNQPAYPQPQYGQPQYNQAAYGQPQYGQQYGQNYVNPIERGEQKERSYQILNAYHRDNSFLEFQDKVDMQRYGRISGFGSIGIFLSLLLPIGLMLNKSMSRQQKMVYFRYGIIAQMGVGALFLYGNYKASEKLKEIDQKYFSNQSLEQIKNYRGNMFMNQTPDINSVGPVMAGLNRQPFGGNQSFYQPQQPGYVGQAPTNAVFYGRNQPEPTGNSQNKSEPSQPENKEE